MDVCFHQHSEFSWNSRCQMVCVAICIPFCSILSRWVVKAVPHGFGSRSPRFALSKGGCPSLLLGLVTCAEPLSCGYQPQPLQPSLARALLIGSTWTRLLNRIGGNRFQTFFGGASDRREEVEGVLRQRSGTSTKELLRGVIKRHFHL